MALEKAAREPGHLGLHIALPSLHVLTCSAVSTGESMARNVW